MYASRMNSGIYAIVNTTNGKCYVGQASSFAQRWGTHRSQLRRGVHHCAPLQHAWLKYGEAAFLFKVLEEAPSERETLYQREQFWMDLIRPAYNVLRIAQPGWLGMKHTPEAKAAISHFHRTSEVSKKNRDALHAVKKGVPRTPETIEKMRKSMTGKKHSPETIALLKKIGAASTYKPSAEHIEKLRRIHTGRKLSPEHIEKTRAANTGRKQSPEHIAKRVAKLVGHTTSEHTKQRIAEANRARLLGTKQSAELIEKRIAKLRGKKRDPEVIAVMHAALAAKRQPTLDAIQAALLIDPQANITHLAAKLGCARSTIRRIKKELLCQQPPQNASAAAEKSSPPKQADLFMSP